MVSIGNVVERPAVGRRVPQRFDHAVEALFIATNPQTGLREVWFRDDQQVTALPLTLQGAEPVEVKWGVREDAFFVRTDDGVYRSFRIARGLTTPLGPVPPSITPLRVERPWEPPIVLLNLTTQVTYRSDWHGSRVETTATESEHTRPPAAWTRTHAESHSAKSYPQPEAAGTGTGTITLTKDVLDRRAKITSAILDADNHLVLTVQLYMSLSWLPPVSVPPVSIPSRPVFFKTDDMYQKTVSFQGPLVAPPMPQTYTSEHGDPRHLDGPLLETGPWGTSNVRVPFASDIHLFVVDVTAKVVLWSTCRENPAIVWSERADIYDALGQISEGHTSRDATTAYWAGPGGYEILEYRETHDVLSGLTSSDTPPRLSETQYAQWLVNHPSEWPTKELPAIFPWPIVRGLDNDCLRASFAEIRKALYRRDTHTAKTFTVYEAIIRDSPGDQPEANVRNLYLAEFHEDWDQTLRQAAGVFDACYVPRRSRQKGEEKSQPGWVALSIQVTGGGGGVAVIERRALWVIDLVTDAIKVVLPLTADLVRPTAVVVLGATPTSLLWLFRRGPVADIRLTTLLTGETASVLAEAPLATVQTFLAEHRLQLLRFDAVFRPFDQPGKTAGAKDNRFIKAWGKNGTPILSANPVIDSGWTSAQTALRNLPKEVIPLLDSSADTIIDGFQSKGPSYHVVSRDKKAGA